MGEAQDREQCEEGEQTVLANLSTRDQVEGSDRDHESAHHACTVVDEPAAEEKDEGDARSAERSGEGTHREPRFSEGEPRVLQRIVERRVHVDERKVAEQPRPGLVRVLPRHELVPPVAGVLEAEEPEPEREEGGESCQDRRGPRPRERLPW